MLPVVLEFEKLNDMNCGLGQVCYHLGKSLEKLNPNLFYYMPSNRFSLFPEHLNFIAAQKLHRKLSFLAPKAELWHCLHQDSQYLPRNSNAKVILTIHDLNFLYENRSEQEAKKRLKILQEKIDRAKALTYVSQFTQSEVEKNLNTQGKVQKVIYNGLGLNFQLPPVKPQGVFEGEFLFAVGTVVAKKNFHVLIDFMEKLPGLNLLLAGWSDNSYAREMKATIKAKGLDSRFIMLGTISEAEKIWLYQNCKAFAFPSLQEGFGMPVVEAMSFGKPVFLSRCTSLPEIGGPLAFYFDNFEPSSMKNTFEKGMATFQADSAYADKLKTYALKFSWDLAAQEYHKLYIETLSN